MKKKLVPIIMALGVFIPTQAFAATGDSIIKTGEKYLGQPYSYGASIGDLSKFDCSSFTAQVFKENGITLPRASRDQAKSGTAVSASNLQKGDLVFYDTDYDGVVNHVGIYAGSNKMINAASSKGVSYADTSNSYWKPRYVSARRVLSTKQPTVQTTNTSTAKTTYTVVKGDSLWKISKKYGTTVAKLKSANNLKSDLIRIGQKLVIPK
ncbi:NlpC/P60 family protein [Priestia sp. YIM B13551]|uniref:NlpC/P60 family protein n=1 Tax=Priestia sp. YIM B13551 TaxID=3366306 RepID=UPI00366EA6D0